MELTAELETSDSVDLPHNQVMSPSLTGKGQ